MTTTKSQRPTLRHLSASFNNGDLQSSALRLVFALFPDWEQDEGEIKLTRFTDGITNTLLKASKRKPGRSEKEIDDAAVLIRAYGKGSEVLIDRDREMTSHLLLASHGLAPELLAKFQNGMIYRYIPGRVCSAADLRREAIWKAVATRLGQWHATLPVKPAGKPAATSESEFELCLSLERARKTHSQEEIDAITPDKVVPNMWTTLQKWIYALPTTTTAQREQQQLLQRELLRTLKDLGDLPGLGEKALVLSHCDLLSGNVIRLPPMQGSIFKEDDMETVTFIDYEYATPAPAAFDLANHFAEWGGFDCDYNALPTRSTRRAFLSQYLTSYKTHRNSTTGSVVLEEELNALCEAVDLFRGTPGLYWGTWGLIQAEISQIDFDYATYAQVRLGEYFAWREEADGSRAKAGREIHPRERRLAEQ